MAGLMALVAYGAQDITYEDEYNHGRPLTNLSGVESYNHSLLYIPKRWSNTEYTYRKIKNDIMCPIKYEDILEGELYTYCEQCNHNFSKSVFDWIQEHKTCPMCRNSWDTFTTYKNVEEDEENYNTVWFSATFKRRTPSTPTNRMMMPVMQRKYIHTHKRIPRIRYIQKHNRQTKCKFSFRQ